MLVKYFGLVTENRDKRIAVLLFYCMDSPQSSTESPQSLD